MNSMQYDVIIIGFGKAGKTLAGKFGKAGKSVALIERDPKMYGGTCINVGCIPSKSLIHSAAAADPKAAPQTRFDVYRAAIAEKRRLTAALRQKNYDKLANLPTVTIYDGEARFTGPRQVEVTTETSVLQLTGTQVFINTGSVSRIPPIAGVHDTEGVYTSAGLMDLETFPERLVIIGGGYIGLEFASMYSGFGSQVTVLQDGETFLPKEDRDIAQQIQTILEARGVEFQLGAQIERIETGPDVVFTRQGVSQRLDADAVLVATGRVPNTADLNCAATGVELTPRGAIQVDAQLRTTAPGVWALGDVTGGLQHTYISLDDSRIVWAQLTGGKANTTEARRNVPYSVFLATPYSRVGMNEQEAAAAGRAVRIAKLPAAAIPKAQVLKQPAGLLKAVIDAETGKILGAMLLCEESYEMINVIKLAMDLDVEYTVLRDRIYTHPTMTEALNDLFDL